jgi:hypothetical protein
LNPCRATAPRRISTRISGVALLAALALTPAGAGSAPNLPEHQQLIDARDLICHFRKAGAPAPKLFSQWEPESDLMIVIEDIDGEAKTARAVSTRSAGRKPLNMYQTETRVHFVQQVERSVVVTTVEGCETWRSRRGERVCQRYRAVNAWHFDESVRRDPDRSFLRLPGTSYQGHCEPWKLD